MVTAKIPDIIREIMDKKKKQGGLTHVYFAACGGSLGAFYPAKALLENEATQLCCNWITSNELVHCPPAALGENAVLIVASHRGNTPETIEAAKLAQRLGASVIGLTYLLKSALPAACDYVLGYTFGDDRDVAGEKAMMGLRLAAELLHQTEGYAHYDAFQKGVDAIDSIVKNARKTEAQKARDFARTYQDDKIIYTMGSGGAWGAAYMQAICIFMEMQWINAASIHTGEYFHGPFEITDEMVPFVLQMSCGKTRPLDERALDFLKRYAKRFTVLDARKMDLDLIDATVVDYFNHSLFNNVYSVYNQALAIQRRHPLSTRRYMWQVEY